MTDTEWPPEKWEYKDGPLRKLARRMPVRSEHSLRPDEWEYEPAPRSLDIGRFRKEGTFVAEFTNKPK